MKRAHEQIRVMVLPHDFDATTDGVSENQNVPASATWNRAVRNRIAEYSPYALVTPDDPPIYLTYETTPAVGQDQQKPAHSANYGVKLQEHCREIGVPCELVYPGAADIQHANTRDYLIEKLKAEVQQASELTRNLSQEAFALLRSLAEQAPGARPGP